MKLIIFLWIFANVLYVLLAKRVKVRQNDIDDTDYLPLNDAEKEAIQKLKQEERIQKAMCDDGGKSKVDDAVSNKLQIPMRKDE